MNIMPATFRKLSHLTVELANPQRSDRFVRELRLAVRDGVFRAIFLKEYFVLPKEFRSGKKQRRTRDMLIECSDEFETWLAEINRELARPVRGAPVPVTERTVTTGAVNFDALAEATSELLERQRQSGQRLGQQHGRFVNKKS
ncbi:hypothetical protein [Deinococcus sp. Marseille-Q6407]|uniref:hypothetical protein n=1 Tax=Deinococcus sp. Marseille-Q6407 TaxID=2969223 RepID=UPI0021BFD4E2|nr:hypothetical protein [Deinococcus sp. Marseille-Q6407]